MNPVKFDAIPAEAGKTKPHKAHSDEPNSRASVYYTIKDAAALLNVPTSTIRFYDKEGLFPLMTRSKAGYRLFSEDDMALLRVIDCLKKTGMPIKEIRQFTDWVREGDASLEQRYQMFLERRQSVEAQMAELQGTLDMINHKCRYYETAIAAGTEAMHFKNKDTEQLPCETTV